MANSYQRFTSSGTSPMASKLNTFDSYESFKKINSKILQSEFVKGLKSSTKQLLKKMAFKINEDGQFILESTFDCIKLKEFLFYNKLNVTPRLLIKRKKCDGFLAKALKNFKGEILEVDIRGCEEISGLFKDLKKISSINKVVMHDNITKFDNFFENCCRLKTLPKLKMKKATSTISLCENCSNLVTFEEEIDYLEHFTKMFSGCINLENISQITLNKNSNQNILGIPKDKNTWVKNLNSKTIEWLRQYKSFRDIKDGEKKGYLELLGYDINENYDVVTK